jgi:hypothetical protein
MLGARVWGGHLGTIHLWGCWMTIFPRALHAKVKSFRWMPFLLNDDVTAVLAAASTDCLKGQRSTRNVGQLAGICSFQPI